MVKIQLVRGLFVSCSFLLASPFAIRCEGYDNGHGIPKKKLYDPPSLAEKNRSHLNKHAKQFVKNYIRNNRKELYIIRQRSRSPFAIVDSIFSKYNLPVQLKYLAVIESELKPGAISRVGAVGPWQLMPKTAKILGLDITQAHDERTQYYKSTKAAARYLKDLYAEFGDWLLVLAAYNGGPGPVDHAIHLSRSRNFWDLQGYLPAESRGHVKKFIAALYYFEGQESVAAFTRAEHLPLRTTRESQGHGTQVRGILASRTAASANHAAGPNTAEYMPRRINNL
jgi:membrane-bound lytic murein transglycosylase D